VDELGREPINRYRDRPHTQKVSIEAFLIGTAPAGNTTQISRPLVHETIRMAIS
jgi:hypothetical protein